MPEAKKHRANERPDPDALLSELKNREAEKRSGRLKIFFGMCAGVGKTYSMLQEAQMLRAERRNPVVGYVETHGRPETEALLKGLEVIPRRTMTHRGVVLTEFDLDAVLQRMPEIVLVDELAHTNVPDSRHPKRYQDVIELLDHGINVYTTLNVQHLESRAGTVSEITGTPVRETVPDSLLDLAKEIELVDISPQELLKRLAEGKVYTPEKSKQAVQHFFRQSNLTALREMALRVTAGHVERQLHDTMKRESISGPWKTGERLMVAVSWSPYSAAIISWTRRLATTMNASWMAVYVETTLKLSMKQTDQLMNNLRLARELGAEVLTVPADNPVDGLLQTAYQHNITQIVVGKPMQNRLIRRLKGGSIVDRLISNSGNIDIYVIREEINPEPSRRHWCWPRISNYRQYVLAFAAIITTISILFASSSLISYLAVGMFLLFIVTLLSLWLSRGPVLFAAALSALLWNYLFIPPLFVFSIARYEDWILLGMYFIIAIVTGIFTTKIRRKEEMVRKRETKVVALYFVSRELASANSIDSIAHITIETLGRIFDADITLYLQRDDKWSPHPASTFQVSEKEQQVVRWVAKNRKPAGKFTETLPSAIAHYEPLLTPRSLYGVIGIYFKKTQVFTIEQETLLENFTNQIAAAIEREVFHEQRHRDMLTAESERFYKILLNSVSHEFRTPITVISGAVGSLLDKKFSLTEETRKALLSEMSDATNRLNRLVENLLDMSRLESGKIRPKLEWCDVSDLFNSLQRRYKTDLAKHQSIFTLTPNLPLVRMDTGLVEQAVGNLIENAIHYTPQKTKIEISATLSKSTLVIVVKDEGPGFSREAIPHLFDKFYRIPGTVPGGTGLGLSISKGLIEIMKGSILVDNRPTGGAIFTMSLPVVVTQTATLEHRHA